MLMFQDVNSMYIALSNFLFCFENKWLDRGTICFGVFCTYYYTALIKPLNIIKFAEFSVEKLKM